MIKRILAVLAVFGLVALMAAPAGAATSERTDWLNINTEPGGVCGYTHAEVDAEPALPGTANWVSYGTTSYRDVSPCTPGTTNVTVPYGYLKVQVLLNCRVVDSGGHGSGEFNAWTGNVKLNAENTGAVSGGLPSTAYNPCVGDFGLTPQLRTIVRSWYLTFTGYVEYTHTTHWVDVP